MGLYTTSMKNAVEGILRQFCELGGAIAVALCDARGGMVASAGDGGATAALGAAVAKLLRGVPYADLFDDSPEHTILRQGPDSVSLHLRRVGDDWTLAAVWADDGPCDAGDGVILLRPERVRRYAAETALRLQNVS